MQKASPWVESTRKKEPKADASGWGHRGEVQVAGPKVVTGKIAHKGEGFRKFQEDVPKKPRNR